MFKIQKKQRLQLHLVFLKGQLLLCIGWGTLMTGSHKWWQKVSDDRSLWWSSVLGSSRPFSVKASWVWPIALRTSHSDHFFSSVLFICFICQELLKRSKLIDIPLCFKVGLVVFLSRCICIGTNSHCTNHISDANFIIYSFLCYRGLMTILICVCIWICTFIYSCIFECCIVEFTLPIFCRIP